MGANLGQMPAAAAIAAAVAAAARDSSRRPGYGPKGPAWALSPKNF